MLRSLSALFDRLERVSIVLATVCLVGMAALMNAEVFGRTLLGRSTQISDEYAGYGLTAITMLCSFAAMRRGRFLRVEGVIERLPRKLQAALELFAGLVGAAVSAVLAWTTWQLAATSLAYGSVSLQSWQTPLAVPQAIMPIGFLLLAVAYLETAVRRARELRVASSDAGR